MFNALTPQGRSCQAIIVHVAIFTKERMVPRSVTRGFDASGSYFAPSYFVSSVISLTRFAHNVKWIGR